MMVIPAPGGRPEQEPPVGSVVAIDWGGVRQEIWIASEANIGNWYSLTVPVDHSHGHPTWADVLNRARGRTLTLLVPADPDAYQAGYLAGVDATAHAVTEAIDDARHPAPTGPAHVGGNPDQTEKT